MRITVAGSNHKTKNIGAQISDSLRSSGHTVVELGKHDQPQRLQYAFGDNQPDALVVCNGAVDTVAIDDPGYHLSLSRILQANLEAPMEFVSRQALRWRNDGPRGSRRKVILLGSMAHRKVLTGMSAYSAAKAGLDMFTRSAAWELRDYADVFCIHPASVRATPMAQDIVEQSIPFKDFPDHATAQRAWLAGNPRGLSSPDIAQVVKFLIAPEASLLSGSSFEMNGGER